MRLFDSSKRDAHELQERVRREEMELLKVLNLLALLV